ncbi:MAG: TRAP transporter large permease [Brevinema sp.]
MATVLFISFLILLLLGVPVAFSLGLACLIFFLLEGIPIIAFAQKMYSGLDSFTLLCIPGFILAGNLMNGGGITAKIIGFAKSLVGHIRGGLGMANIVSSMVFAGISGTALADVASIGAVMIPTMKKEGYKAHTAVAISVSSSLVGPIIPPSVPMIIVGTLTGLSVGKLFIAGIVPGLLLGLGMMFIVYFIARKYQYPTCEKTTLKQKFSALLEGSWALMMVVIILFGILGGFFTPTEASIISVIYALLVGFFVYKELTVSNCLAIIMNSIKTTSGIMLLVGFANVFAWILASEQIPQQIANTLLGITTNKVIILLLVNLVLIIAGMFLETLSALLILVPVLLKIVVAVGVDPLQFGIMAVLNLVIGLTTPPVGVCLFVGSSIGKIRLSESLKGMYPFFIWMLIVLLLTSYVPAITTWLPQVFE